MDATPAAKAKPTAPAAVWYMAVLLCAIFAVGIIHRLVIALLVPGIKGSLQISDTQVSLLQGAAFAFCFALAGLPFGRLVDRLNRRNLLFFGIVGSSVATVACGLSETFPQLVAARIAVGISQAILTPAAVSIATDGSPPEVRGRVIAIIISGGTFGGAAANMAGGALLDLFAANPILPSPFGGALAPWQSTLVVAGVVGLLLAPMLLTMREPGRRTQGSAGDFRLFQYLGENRRTFLPLFVAFATSFLLVGYAVASWMPVILLRNLHLAPTQAGLTLGAITLAGAIIVAMAGGLTSDLFARRDPRAGRVTLFLIILIPSLLGLLAVPMLGWPVLVIAGFAVFATMTTLMSGLASTIISELSPSEGRGRMMAFYQVLGVIFGVGLAPTVVALVTDQVLRDEGKVPLSLLIIGAPALLISMLSILIARPHARRLREKVAAAASEA